MADLFLIDPTFHRDLNASSTDSPIDGSTNSTATGVMESYKNMLQAKDVEFGDPDSEAKQEHGDNYTGSCSKCRQTRVLSQRLHFR